MKAPKANPFIMHTIHSKGTSNYKQFRLFSPYVDRHFNVDFLYRCHYNIKHGLISSPPSHLQIFLCDFVAISTTRIMAYTWRKRMGRQNKSRRYRRRKKKRVQHCSQPYVIQNISNKLKCQTLILSVQAARAQHKYRKRNVRYLGIEASQFSVHHVDFECFILSSHEESRHSAAIITNHRRIISTVTRTWNINTEL